MRLEPFDPLQAAALSAWAPSDAEVRAWCSRERGPVPAEVIAGWGREPGVTACLLTQDGAPVADGELGVDAAEREAELAHLIVSPERRARGVGRRLAAELATRARRIHPQVFLRVVADHAAALRCYAAAGFARVSAADEERWNRGQPVPYVWMRHA